MKTRLLALLGVVVLAAGAPGQELRVASYNMERLGQDAKDDAVLARVVASFDVVAAEEVMNARGPARLLARLGAGWADFVSPSGEGSRSYQEHFGFFYDSAVEVIKVIGEYPVPREFFRPPFGLRMRVKATGFAFTLVACHIVYGSTAAERRAEIAHLGEVYRWFEHQAGDTSSTIIAGDFNDDTAADFASLQALDNHDVIPKEGTTIGRRGPDHWYDHIFVPAALQARVEKAGADYWTTDYAGSRKNESDHFPVSLLMDVRK